MLHTIAAPDVLDDLARRLQRLTPETARRWGTLTMSTRAWQRWACKHTEHHLRQFGL
jgi:hypothetical protein